MTYKNHTPSTRRNHWYWHFGKHLRARSVCACEGTWLSEPPNWQWMQTREGMNGHCSSKEEIGSREINPHRCSHKRHPPQLHRWHFSGWKKTRQTLNSFTLGQKHTHTQTRTPHAIIHPSFVPLALPPQLWNGETATVHFPNKSQWFLQENGCGLSTWT